MLVTSVYNMADTYFVSQLGTSAAGAVGVALYLAAPHMITASVETDTLALRLHVGAQHSLPDLFSAFAG